MKTTSKKIRKVAKKAFPKQKRNEHLFTAQDYAALKPKV